MNDTEKGDFRICGPNSLFWKALEHGDSVQEREGNNVENGLLQLIQLIQLINEHIYYELDNGFCENYMTLNIEKNYRKINPHDEVA